MRINDKHLFWLILIILILSVYWALEALSVMSWGSFLWNFAVSGGCVWNLKNQYDSREYAFKVFYELKKKLLK